MSKVYKVLNVRFYNKDGEEYVHFEDLKNFLLEREAEAECKNCFSITTIAKEYGMSAFKLNNYLCKKHIQYRKRQVWHLYRKYADCGYVATVSGVNKKTYMYWTYRGKKFIEQLLEKDGFSKIIED